MNCHKVIEAIKRYWLAIIIIAWLLFILVVSIVGWVYSPFYLYGYDY